MRLTTWLPVIILLMLSMTASAHGESVTLQQAIAIALKENPVLKSYGWKVKAQEEELNSTKGNLYPKVTIEERFQRTNNPTYGFMAKLNQERFTQDDFRINSLNNPDGISDFQTSLNLEQPLFVPEVYDGIKIAGKELEAMESVLRMKKNEVTLHVLKAFNMIQTGREYHKAAQKGIEDALEHKRLASLRYDSGTGLYSDVLRAEVTVSRARAMLIKAESDLEIAMRSLGLLLGRSGPVDVKGEIPFLHLDDLNIYLNASKQREDLKAWRLRYENSQKAVKMQKSFFLPKAGIGASYFMNDHNSPFSPEGESYLLMGFLRWNLIDASAYYKVKDAKIKVHEMEEHVAGLKKEIHFRVNEAYIRAREKEQALSLSRAVFKEAEEALRLVRIRYENSLAPIVDLLDTQVMLNTARAGLVEAENEHINSLAHLYYQSGTLLKTVLANLELSITNENN